jgi:hypothetical protein
VVENFEAADANGDGKVSASEAMAYDRESSTGTSAASDSTTSSSTASDGALMHRLMELMRLR